MINGLLMNTLQVEVVVMEESVIIPEVLEVKLEEKVAGISKIKESVPVAFGREFLLRFQSACLDKPDDLPNLDVILDEPTDGHRKPPAHNPNGRYAITLVKLNEVTAELQHEKLARRAQKRLFKETQNENGLYLKIISCL